MSENLFFKYNNVLNAIYNHLTRKELWVFFLWNFMELAVKNHMAIKSAMTAKTDLKVIWPAGIFNTKEKKRGEGKYLKYLSSL